MKLTIDTTSAEKITILLNGKKHSTSSKVDKSQKLLPFIISTLKKYHKTIYDLSEISVNTGPGSFVGVRVGVSVALALGYALAVPVNGTQDAKKLDISYVKSKYS